MTLEEERKKNNHPTEEQKKKSQVINFGCRLNAYESEAIKEIISSKDDQENLIIFNSCAVTANAEKQLRQSIRQTAKQYPESKIVVTGCAAQIDPKKYASMTEVNLVLGNADKFKKENYFNPPKTTLNKDNDPLGTPNQHADQLFIKESNTNNSFIDKSQEAKILVNDIMSIKETSSHMISGFENQSRAFVQIQNGCNHRCTFCIIPYGRGNSRSVAFGEIVTQIKNLVKKGYNEVVLTGVDVSDYGKDLIDGLTFSKMLIRLFKLVPELPRLRISSIDVAEIDDDFLELLRTQPRLMPYLHISLQAGDDLILKRMKRRHTRSQIIDFCHKARQIRPEITFGSDIIAGFPTETEENFQNTLHLIKEANIIFNHIFPYSARIGTPAAKMPQIEDKIKKQRAKQLRQAGEEQLQIFLTGQIGTSHSAILEENNMARGENFIPIKIEHLNNTTKAGSIINVKIANKKDGQLFGQIEPSPAK
jgi:threonylcarbamoyladenosine tRNA methylthiotransferase MtaB